MVIIIRASGEKSKFDEEKAMRSCILGGASEALAREVVSEVRKHLYDGITTSRLKSLIYRELHRRESHTARKYDLRQAIAELDPYLEFERYIARLFAHFGYNTIRSPEPKPFGLCTDHEIDVFMEKEGVTSFIECKHHYQYHVFTGLDVPMRVWARLEDLREGYRKQVPGSFPFDEAWVVVNTKFSEHAIDYAKCKKIRMIGWSYPEGQSLQYHIDKSKAYPLTMLHLPRTVRINLAERNVATVRDLLGASRSVLLSAGMTPFQVKESLALAEQLVS